MALPSIAPYPLPSTEDLPTARHAWQLEPGRAALLVHDMQQYFLAPYAGNGTIEAVIRNIAALIQAARRAGWRGFSPAPRATPPRSDRGLQAELWGPGMRACAEHEAIAAPLQPGSQDHLLVKHRYSAFQRSPLAQMLQARQRDQLLICGVYAHIGCALTAAEAFQHDIEPFMVADALADFNQGDHLMALRWGASTCATPIMAGAAVHAIAGQAPASPAAGASPSSNTRHTTESTCA